jgi:antitoxin component YwqK of YwqJK toxin-antitoxin module
MATRQIHILLLIVFATIQAFSQVDTLIYAPPSGSTFQEICNDKGKKCTYWVDGKPTTKANYDNNNTQRNKISLCKPCWLKYKDKGQLVYEGDFYEDCCIGTYIERYSNGNLKVKGQYKTPATKIPDYNKGDCRRHGSWTYYKLNGDIEKQEVYKDGVLIPSP